MIRYIGMAWNSLDDTRCLEAANLKKRIRQFRSNWAVCVDEAGQYVTCGAAELPRDISVLPDRCGVFIGPAFSAGSARESDAMTRTELARDVITTGGKAAIEQLWGSYILFVLDSFARTTYIVRSPVAQIPCFYAIFRGITISFSAIDDLLALSAIFPTIDWQIIRAQATNRDYLTRATALREVTSLECGECLVVAPERNSLRMYWSPSMVTRGTRIRDFERAVLTVSTLTRECVSAWASRHQNILHTLSGGLDSSIVLACLRGAPNAPKITCLNQHSPGHIGDERRFARSMAAKWGVELLEIQRNPDASISRFLECVRTVRPVLHFSGIDCYSTYVREAQALGATAIFDGELGDNVFGSLAGYEVVSQALREYGVSRYTLEVALDYALLRKRSVWSVLANAARDNAGRNKSHHWSMHHYMLRVFDDDPKTGGFIADEALADYEANIERHLHPWLLDIDGVPFGLFGLFFALLTITSSSYHQPFARSGDPASVSPLVSQPLVDASLSIDVPLHI